MMEFSFAFLFAAIVCIGIGIWCTAEEIRFKVNHEVTTGILTGYYVQDYKKWDSPIVLLNIGGIETRQICKSKGMNSRICPAGTELRVAYYEKKTLGIKHLDARIDEEEFRAYSPVGAARFLVVFGLVLIGLALIFLKM